MKNFFINDNQKISAKARRDAKSSKRKNRRYAKRLYRKCVKLAKRPNIYNQQFLYSINKYKDDKGYFFIATADGREVISMLGEKTYVHLLGYFKDGGFEVETLEECSVVSLK